MLTNCQQNFRITEFRETSVQHFPSYMRVDGQTEGQKTYMMKGWFFKFSLQMVRYDFYFETSHCIGTEARKFVLYIVHITTEEKIQ
jgi:hypothetical protein